MNWVGFTSFGLILTAALAVGAVYVAKRLKTEDLNEIVIALGIIFLTTMFVFAIVNIFCAAISPIERFENPAPDPVTTLFRGIEAAEKDVCEYIERANKFIQSDLGKAGHDNPQLVDDAKQKALTGVILVTCPPVITDISDQTLTEADFRLSALESTLSDFTGVQFTDTYNRTVKCETFQDISGSVELASLQQRLQAVQAEITTQKKTLLDPIDQKTEELKKGELSDCDKQRGANTAMKGKALPSGA